ncbi:MAG TPA: hypothetical protein VLE50_01595 [Cellvibrio sp.]|nr:hypothetical protein [Cellvibrio sp.]
MILGGIEITDNFIWSDEFDYNQVEQAQERSLTGGMIIQHGVKHFGRPITLGESWLPRFIVDALFALEATTAPMLLGLPDGRSFSVVFDRSRGIAIDAKPVDGYVLAANDPNWQYKVTVRLLTVEPEES